jgi:hypothetical protein
LSFFYSQAELLAQTAVGNPQAFMLIHSGYSVRKRDTWHVHVFVVEHRWQKAWVYAVLSIKSIALALHNAIRGKPEPIAHQSVQTDRAKERASV